MAWNPNACVSYSWDAAGQAAGLSLARAGNRLHVRAVARESGPEPLPAKLGKLARALNPAGTLVAVAGGHLPGLFCTEFNLPVRRLAPADLTLALEQELPLHLPCPLADVAWTWRVVEDHGKAGPCRIRVAALPRADWERLLEGLAAAGLTLDAVLLPWMAIDPLLAGKDVALPAADPEATLLAPGTDGCRQLKPAADPKAVPTPERLAPPGGKVELPPDFPADGALLTALLLGAATLDGACLADHAGLLPLPATLQPRRYRGWKLATASFGVLAALLALLLAGRWWLDGRARIAALAAERTAAGNHLKQLQLERTRHAALDDLLERASAVAAGDPDLLPVLAFLAQRLPDEMWLASFTSADNRSDVDLRARGESDDALMEQLANSPLFTIDTVNKRRNPDGTTQLSLKLKRTTPELALDRLEPLVP